MDKKIAAIVENAAFLAEKGRQVAPGSLTAFGIQLCSRYAKAEEIVELLRFAEEATKACVAPYVKSVFYDSNSRCCSFELDNAVEFGSDIERELRIVGNRTLSQFDWFGTVLGHGFADGGEYEEG
jgi:hypothetical protein